jgi:pyridoxamine 5'-phosphate oxidase
MNKTEILAFINANRLSFLATVEGKKPHVRGMETYRADTDGLVFYTRKTKDVHQQLAKNPEAEICYCDFKTMTQIRVSGRLELIEDLEIKKEIVANRSFLKPLIDKEGWDNMAVYRLKHGKATVWTMPTMAALKTYVDL